jgi:hypothetical protein
MSININIDSIRLLSLQEIKEAFRTRVVLEKIRGAFKVNKARTYKYINLIVLS